VRLVNIFNVYIVELDLDLGDLDIEPELIFEPYWIINKKVRFI